MKKERIRVGLPQILSACVLAFVVALMFVVENFAAITTLELTLQELPLSYYLAVISFGSIVLNRCAISLRFQKTASHKGTALRSLQKLDGMM